MDVDVTTEETIQSSGLSCYYAAVATATIAVYLTGATTMAVATITTVFGLSFFFCSVAAAVDVAVATTVCANLTKKGHSLALNARALR